MRHYKRDGTPYKGSLDQVMVAWGKDLADPKKKVVKQETLENGLWISTVWLGLDHNYGEGRPLIFETMVFKKKGDWSELDMDRYSTEKEAIKGHERMVKKWAS